jgi:hypothetical protein
VFQFELIHWIACAVSKFGSSKVAIPYEAMLSTGGWQIKLWNSTGHRIEVSQCKHLLTAVSYLGCAGTEMPQLLATLYFDVIEGLAPFFLRPIARLLFWQLRTKLSKIQPYTHACRAIFRIPLLEELSFASKKLYSLAPMSPC